MTQINGTQPHPTMTVKFSGQGDAGTFTYTSPTGVETIGDLKLKDPVGQTLKDELSNFLGQQVIPSSMTSVAIAGAALLIPFFAVVVVGPLLGDTVSNWINLLLAGIAAFVGVAAALSSVKTAPHIVFGLTLFSAWSAVVLVFAKVFGLPGA